MRLLLKTISSLLISCAVFLAILPTPTHALFEGSVLTSLIVGANVLLTDGCPPREASNQPPLSYLWAEGISLENHILKCSEEMVGLGAIRMTKQALASMYLTQPASAGDYLAHMSNKLNPTPAYAQGFGAQQLEPVLKIWAAFRNVTYIIYILMFVIIGLMVMFRSKINPQTIVSIQAALPNLIITLLLITFSYAIAGFLIDLMYWSIYTLVALFEATGILVSDPAGTATIDTIDNFIFSKNLFQIRNALNGTALGGIGGAKELLRETLFNIWPGPVPQIYWAFVGWLVFNIAMLISLLKAVFELIKAYLMIILYIVTAPLQIMVNAVPGSDAFLTWLRCLAGHLAVFPVVAAFLLIGAALMGEKHDAAETWWPSVSSGVGYSASGPAGFVPPFIFADGDPTTGSGTGIQVVQGLLGIAIILLLPAVVEMVKEAFQCKTGDYGKVIQQNWSEAQGHYDKGLGYAGKTIFGVSEAVRLWPKYRFAGIIEAIARAMGLIR